MFNVHDDWQQRGTSFPSSFLSLPAARSERFSEAYTMPLLVLPHLEKERKQLKGSDNLPYLTDLKHRGNSESSDIWCLGE